MSLKDCLNSARDQGAITGEEADELLRTYEALKRAKAGEANPDKAALDALGKKLFDEMERKEYLAGLSAATVDRIKGEIAGFRNTAGRADIFEGALKLFEHQGFAGFSSLLGRRNAITSIAHGRLADALGAFERNFYTGGRGRTRPLADDVTREIMGEATGKPEAKALADAFASTFEWLRERFNAAGAMMAKIENYMPQSHNPLAVLRAGYDAWRNAILPRLAVHNMEDPLTGGAISTARMDELLREAYASITTGGEIRIDPQMRPMGRGALANQRQEHRFFQFRSAEDWLAYDRDFGFGDPVKAMFQHVNGMAKDIAALEILGPNPFATVEWLKQAVRHEAAKAQDGKQSLFDLRNWTKEGERFQGQYAAFRIDNLYNHARGRQVISGQIAETAGDLRNVLTSALLGSASLLAATTDPALEAATRRAIGMPLKKLLGTNAKVFTDAVTRYLPDLPVARQINDIVGQMTGLPRERAVRSGLLAEDFVHILGDEARYAGTLGGHNWSKWLADRTVTLFGLRPITEARKHVFQNELQDHIGQLAGKDFAALPEQLRIKMEGYGLGGGEWDAMRAVPLHDGVTLRPIDVAKAAPKAAERYIEMLLGETERAVPSGTLRSRSLVTMNLPRGTIVSELLESFLLFKSFGLSLATLQIEATMRETMRAGKLGGAAYAAGLLIPATLGGALSIQLRHIAQGRDPQEIDKRFWGAALAQGGGFGIFGDFLFADASRFDFTFAEQLTGPAVNFATDVWKVAAGGAARAIRGDETQFANDTLRFISRYTPVVSSGWATRLAYKRLVLDHMQRLLDPKAAERFRNEERRAMRERGQGYWWPPGETAPPRAPNISGVP